MNQCLHSDHERFCNNFNQLRFFNFQFLINSITRHPFWDNKIEISSTAPSAHPSPKNLAQGILL
jgi:hypothetical protein